VVELPAIITMIPEKRLYWFSQSVVVEQLLVHSELVQLSVHVQSGLLERVLKAVSASMIKEEMSEAIF
jgi:hypothetical protein